MAAAEGAAAAPPGEDRRPGEDGRPGWLRHRHARRWMLGAFLLGGLALALWPQKAEFTVSAVTETMTLIVQPEQSLDDWSNLPVRRAVRQGMKLGERVSLIDGCEDARLDLGGQRRAATQFLIQAAPTPSAARPQFTIDRPRAGTGAGDAEPPQDQLIISGVAASNDAVTADISSVPAADGSTASLGRIVCAGGRTMEAPSEVLVGWPKEGLSQPFRGTLEIGSYAGTSPSLLREGTLTASAPSWPRGAAVEASRTLQLGDDVMVYAGRGMERPAVSLGVFRASADGGVRVIARAVGYHADIVRVGYDKPAREAITPSLWARIKAQPVFVTLGAVLGALFYVIETARKLQTISGPGEAPRAPPPPPAAAPEPPKRTRKARTS